MGDGLYLVRGAYNTMFAVVRDFAVVFEAPLSSAFAETVRAQVRATVPDKPVRFVVATHFHFDHLAGVRPYVADGVPLLTTVDAGPVIERVAAASHTLHPDALSRHPVPPHVEVVSDARVIDDGVNRVELYDVGPSEHADHILVAYFPKDRVLFVPDLWDVVSTELVIAGSDTVLLARKVRALGLKVERIVPVHGAPATWEMLERALAVRARYVRD
jgi:glyoxylase-like metal-dependent hydrolase (beta-lactamase superfamily II)